MLTVLINIIGWVGVALLLLAYYLVSTRRLMGDAALYQWLNIAGAVMLSANSFYFGAYPSVGVNVAWVGIGLFALYQIRGKGKS